MRFKVGVETHLCLNTEKKLYCECKADVSYCEVCTARPGWFPYTVNVSAIEKTLVLARMLKSEVAKQLVLSRKHYNYPDLLAGYQLTQNPNAPFCTGGYLEDLSGHKTAVEKILLEEDPAGIKNTNLDLKRAGCCLIELVTKPVFTGTLDLILKRLRTYLWTLKTLVLDLKIVRPEKVMKSDLNISIFGAGFRYEIKNLDSYGKIKKALSEAAKILADGTGKKENYTYEFKKKLIASRTKQKYLYLDEPNLLPVDLQPFKTKSEAAAITLYEIHQMICTAHNYTELSLKDRYLVAKSLLKECNQSKLSRVEILSLLQKSPSELIYYLKNKNVLKNECKITLQLKKLIREKNLTENDFRTKNILFVQTVKSLKLKLVEAQIKFNSELINQIFKTLYSNECEKIK